MDYNNSKYDIPKSIAKIAFSVVPVFGSAIAELINYLDAKHIERRLLLLEQAVSQQDIAMDEFKQRLYTLEDDEHKYYVVRNNIKFLCLNALPETVDSFNKALIDTIMQDDYTMAEYATEIIKQLNSDDIATLKLLRDFQISHGKEFGND